MKTGEWVEAMGGVVSVPEVSAYVGVPAAFVRDWAVANGIRRVGNSFAFFATDVVALEEQLVDDAEEHVDDDVDDDVDDEEDDDEEDEEDEDDEEDDEDDE